MPVTRAGTNARESAVFYSGRRPPYTNVFRQLHRHLCHTQCGPKVLGLTFFKKTKAHEENNTFFNSK